MTWTKLSDDFADDCWTLSDAAFRLHVEGLTWNNRKLLDLRLPKDDVRRFAKHPEAASELVAVGWWSDEGAHYSIRHHATYQRSREAVLRQQEANSRNGARGGRPRSAPRELSEAPTAPVVSESESDSLSEPRTQRDRTGQDRTVRGVGWSDEEDNGWPHLNPPGSGLPCRVCRTSVDPAVGADVHPGCE